LKKSQDTAGDDTTSKMPLRGVRVLDLTRAMAGPFCSMMLADLGADVVKVEPPGGDETRLWGPPFIGEESTYFLSVNRNKKSIVVDLRKEKGVEIVKGLARNSHVLVENYRPGTTEKLGINYEKMKRVNPELIYCSISGFGQTGPDREKPGYDLIAFATSGMMSITGEPGRPPVKVGVPVSDICAGMYAAYAIMSSLYKQEIEKSHRRSTRKNPVTRGDYIDVSMLEGQISWLTHQASGYFATGNNPEPLGSSHPSIAPYQAFRGSEGKYFIIAVGNDDLWKKFCDALSISELRDDPRFISNPKRVENKIQLEKELSKVFSSDSSLNWIQKISSVGVPCCPINKLDEVFKDPQVISRKMVLECEHPSAGKIKQLGLPYHFRDFEFRVRFPPPLLGEHTSEILSGLGYSAPMIEGLKTDQIVH
jgi:crotonobetainyl-CoA:carnitine CoA-transferase CaiB-like acyl-CoA transferase